MTCNAETDYYYLNIYIFLDPLRDVERTDKKYIFDISLNQDTIEYLLQKLRQSPKTQ